MLKESFGSTKRSSTIQTRLRSPRRSNSGTRALLPSGIIWLNRAVQKYSDYDWRERDLDEALAGALQACWRHANAEVASNTGLRSHFLQLLNTLCKRLSADALALRTQVTQFIPNLDG